MKLFSVKSGEVDGSSPSLPPFRSSRNRTSSFDGRSTRPFQHPVAIEHLTPNPSYYAVTFWHR